MSYGRCMVYGWLSKGMWASYARPPYQPLNVYTLAYAYMHVHVHTLEVDFLNLELLTRIYIHM